MAPDPNRPAPTDILIVEDIASLRTIYSAHLRAHGFHTLQAATATEAMSLFAAHAADIVLLDLFLPDRDGLDVLHEMLAIHPGAAIIVVTADQSIDKAAQAMRAGALDFLTKPLDEAALMRAIDAARRHIRNIDRPAPARPAAIGQFISTSDEMRAFYAQLVAAARSAAPVFISGEIGTGRQMAARTIHDLSERAAEAFVELDCATLDPDAPPPELQLPRANGMVRRAEEVTRGTLYLENIDELAPALQIRLHHLHLQPMRETEHLPPPDRARIIATARLPARELAREGVLRDNLAYALDVLSIRTVPLRARAHDIEPLARTLLARISASEGGTLTRISPEAAALLGAYAWPGNVQELRNILRAIVISHDGPELTPTMLPEEIRTGHTAVPDAPFPLAGHTLAEIERMAAEDALARFQGSVPRAAVELGVAPSTLYRKLESWRSKG
ncbi:sigma-54 dependent transcriptional regulator [Thioclava sp. A2]|uniref:sigma-54-dependent transcriptional regulator n=1 Tax=Thioclava sp. FCG-A2 TaxID=3080562 RepID=UPI002952F429|nr:sigma-54 dependent transcriptional regulator [Thioclava sp. A2]MDV7271756.1 sigma-54 dependent transcriptional regulator [Thioclava sp. A2]